MEKVTREDIVEGVKRMKSKKTTGRSEVSLEMIIASSKTEVRVIMDLNHRVFDGGEISDEWKSSQ